MHNSLNLARRPFKNRRLFWVCILTLLIASGIFSAWIQGEIIKADSEANKLRNQIRERENSVKVLKERFEAKRKPEVTATVLTLEQTLELAAARQMITRKEFSWNRLMSHIERYVPDNARILSIKIEEGANTSESSAAALVQIKAAGKTAAQMTEMMEKLERSGGLFEIDQAVQEAISDMGDVPFTLKLIYQPSRNGQGGD